MTSHELPEAIYGGVDVPSPKKTNAWNREPMIVVADPWYLGKEKLGIDGEWAKIMAHFEQSRKNNFGVRGVVVL